MKFSPRILGLFQAAGLTLYVSIFAITGHLIEQWLKAEGIQLQPPLAIIIFLLAFIISAIVSASIVFAYPIFLFFGNEKDEAVRVVLWSLGWLIVSFAAFLFAGSAIILHVLPW